MDCSYNEKEFCMKYISSLKITKDISKDILEEMVDQALKIGKDISKEYVGVHIRELLKMNNIKINLAKGGVYGNKLIRARYDNEEKDITIYEDGIKDVLKKNIIDKIGIEKSSTSIEDIFLCHEFFHFLEFNRFQLLGNKFKVPIRVLGFKIQKPLYEISEISANVFAKEIMGLRYNPIIIDYCD